MMQLINTLFGIPLGYLMYLCYRLVGNYGLSIILFTFITKVIMFPLSLVSQRNSIAMVRMRPQLEEIRRRYAGNGAELAARQKELYRHERYSALKGILPLLIQIPIILGLIHVIYHPLQHILRLESSTIATLLEKTAILTGKTVTGLGTSAELAVLEAVKANTDFFHGMSGVNEILSIDISFLGVSMAELPAIASITVLYPIISGASAFLLATYQNKHNILQRAQGSMSRWVTTIILIAFSAFFAAILPCGVGLYWIAGNLLSIPVLKLCNMIYDPDKLVDELAHLEAPKMSREERREVRALQREKRRRQRIDVKRFNTTKGKRLVFYSESDGFYKYFEGYIDYILEHSDVVIHYVTSDFHDRVFSMNHSRIQAYYVGPIALIRVMMLMDAEVVVMTMPDLGKYHIKRSLVRKDIEYIYTDHGMTSLHLMLQENALDNFDTIFCYGPNHILEVREMERVYGLPPKTLVRTGFPLLDSMIKGAEAISDAVNDPKVILIAPSWQQDNILEYCLDETLRPLLGAGYHIVVRPHPEFIKRFPGKMKAIEERYKDDVGEFFEIQTSFASSETVYSADLVITDWSSIANEFSYATKKPSLFINTPMKVVNPNYEKIPLVPLDISLRDEIGISVDVEDLDTLPDVVRTLFDSADQYKEHIAEVVKENIFDVGNGARGGGQYIVDTLEGRAFETKDALTCDELMLRCRHILEYGSRDEMERILSEPLSHDASIPITKGELILEVLEELEQAMNEDTCDES